MKKIIKKILFILKKDSKVNNYFESMDKLEDYVFKTTRDAYAVKKYQL